ncbi:DUF4129 domain-containing protein [Desulfococcaceae bacterium HSG7]|nr:DUF4129 domain-containing protein [Desulfococcaceae bacterium HSG7]
MIILFVISCLLTTSIGAYAGEHQQPLIFKAQEIKGTVDSETLNHSIEQVLKRSEFTWRLPRDRNIKKEKDSKDYPWPLSMLVAFGDTLEKWFDTLKQWLRHLKKWTQDLFKNDEPDKKTASDSGQWLGSVRTSMLILAVLLVGIGFVIFWKTWRQRSKPEITNAPVVPNDAAPDLDDENVKADQLPSERWIALAQSLFQEGALRQAMRAFYLATLAHLSECGFITIRKYKSDGDYIHELRRRAHTQTDLLIHFTKQVGLFHNVWYGMHSVTATDIKAVAAMQERITHFAETV